MAPGAFDFNPRDMGCEGEERGARAAPQISWTMTNAGHEDF
jgi:hypothetical protein